MKLVNCTFLLLILFIASFDTFADGTLKIISGSINGINLNVSNPTITVEPGESITGQIILHVKNNWHPNSVAPLAGTPSWGDPSKSYWGIKDWVPIGESDQSTNINLTAPTIEGLHYIFFAFNAEMTYANVMSLTNWSIGSDNWEDGVNVANWNELEARMARDSGYVITRCLGNTYSLNNIPAAAIKVDVKSDNFSKVCELPFILNGSDGIEYIETDKLLYVHYGYQAYMLNLNNGAKQDSLLFNISSSDLEGRGIAYDGQNYWYSEWYLDKIFVINPSNGNVINSYNSPGYGPQALAYGGGYIWHTDEYSGSIYKINPSNGAVMSEIPEPEPTGFFVGIAYNKGYLWLANTYSKTIYCIRNDNGSVVDTMQFNLGNLWSDITCDDKYIYIISNNKLYKRFLPQLEPIPVNVKKDKIEIPNKMNIGQNYPNPFNPTTTIEYQLPQRGNVEIKIYNSIGEIIKTLITGEKEAGYYSVVWDGKNDAGNLVTSGVYFYQIKSGSFVQAKKMLLLK
jgi:hypothetical protein